MPLGKSDTPTLWIVAGPNGFGKSTLYTGIDIEEFGPSIWIINPDVLAEHIALHERLELSKANLEAVVRIEEWLRTSVAAYQTVGVETVLSTPKYRPLVLEARRKGFEIRLIYVVLDSVEKNIQRVRQRVERGGHGVPESKIRERYKRSLHQLPWFLRQADRAWLFDNSGAKPNLMATKGPDTIIIGPSTFPAIQKILQSSSAKGHHKVRWRVHSDASVNMETR